ncbi:Pentatricopeptide repeat-containing protein [Colletotrichum orbiculare MAFF 240422]|uniref:Pentatricopeptide repeat-containing protein n=1 Tax=Colletotrichum orbiculare (strain 104-T / ATCC 96160 / CBS 514.97 / LARS 414 / MAFF 240422) TaxID=1213857 RepID=N4VL56_COLOR|nr:Pentatricopeptide repeat-containing protein [Colletotrichum orbiculare MAFF 240422]
MEDALQLWKEMERDASVQGNDITFNILFDAASKSGNFPLAERIYKEMESRNIPFTRFHHVSLIHFFGLKQDPDGVRAAYKEMVEAGEMVDTTVLNCVISSFFKCREVESAMRVYEHMKGIQTKADGFSSKSHHAENATDVLKRLTKISKTCPEFRPKLQELAPTAPDGRTYRTLFEHFAVKTGDFNTVAMLLEDMRTFDVVVNGGIFLVLFKAFKKHGGYVGTDWTADRLSTVLVALLEDLDDGVKGLYLDTWLMMWALRAFGQCTSKEVVLEVYEEFRSRWRLVEDKAQFMDAYLNNLLAGKDGAVHRERFATRMTTRATRK